MLGPSITRGGRTQASPTDCSTPFPAELGLGLRSLPNTDTTQQPTTQEQTCSQGCGINTGCLFSGNVASSSSGLTFLSHKWNPFPAKKSLQFFLIAPRMKSKLLALLFPLLFLLLCLCRNCQICNDHFYSTVSLSLP